MAFTSEYLIARQPLVDRNREIAFHRLSIGAPERDILAPFMLRLANIESLQAGYFLPFAWLQDEVVIRKLSRNLTLEASATDLADEHLLAAREAGFRIALTFDGSMPPSGVDFVIAPWGSTLAATPDTIYSSIASAEEEQAARTTPAMYFGGPYSAMPQHASKRNISPSHALILELIAAVAQEAEPKAIENLFKRDVTLSFKLLRYINSPWFGLASKVESIRHALTVIGYQALYKWLTLLAATAGENTPPCLTLTAMIRARLMELIGARLLDKRDADNLFVTGMLSLLDRVTGVTMEDLLQHVQLPPGIRESLLCEDGKYRRFLHLALACEGTPLPEDLSLNDVDVKQVNLAHLEAIEWATQASRTQ
jgi:hypothetical protein